jgi:hypothetical protein
MNSHNIIRTSPLLFTSAPLPANGRGISEWQAGSNIYISKCLRFVRTGSAHKQISSTRDGDEFPQYPQTPNYFSQALPCLRADGALASGGRGRISTFRSVRNLCVRGVHTSRFLRHGDEFPQYPQTPNYFSRALPCLRTDGTFASGGHGRISIF